MSQRLKLIGVIEPLSGANQQKNWLSCCSSPFCHANDHCTQLLAFARSRRFPKRSLEMLLYISSKETKPVGQRLSLENNCKSSLHNSVFKLLASHCRSRNKSLKVSYTAWRRAVKRGLGLKQGDFLRENLGEWFTEASVLM